MNTRERYTAIKEHFEVEQNVIDLMRDNEWSIYLYDNFDVSASDVREEFWYNEMMRRCFAAWMKISPERQREIIDATEEKWARREIWDNHEAAVEHSRDS